MQTALLLMGIGLILALALAVAATVVAVLAFVRQSETTETFAFTGPNAGLVRNVGANGFSLTVPSPAPAKIDTRTLTPAPSRENFQLMGRTEFFQPQALGTLLRLCEFGARQIQLTVTVYAPASLISAFTLYLGGKTASDGNLYTKSIAQTYVDNSTTFAETTLNATAEFTDQNPFLYIDFALLSDTAGRAYDAPPGLMLAVAGLVMA